MTVVNDEIPVTFEFKGKVVKGLLNQPNGGGSNNWFLSVYESKNGMTGWFHWGVLIRYMNDDWRMTNTRGDLLHLSDYFRDVVIAWFE